VILNYKKIDEDAIAPFKAHDTDAAFDLTVHSFRIDNEYLFIEYDSGIMVDIPVGYTGFLYHRSGSSNTNLMMANAVGLIDPGYLVMILFRLRVVIWCVRLLVS